MLQLEGQSKSTDPCQSNYHFQTESDLEKFHEPDHTAGFIRADDYLILCYYRKPLK